MEGQQRASLKDRLRQEMRDYLIISLFFALVLGVFNFYRRQILGEAGDSYLRYGASVIEALILAKIVLIGQAMNLKLVGAARRSIFEVAVLRSVLFAVLVLLVAVLERIVMGLIHGMEWAGIAQSIAERGLNEIVARVIVTFAAFLPFFALWELRRRLGPRRFFELWFSRTDPASPGDGSL